MAQVINDYTAAEIQTALDEGRDFELEHDERRLVIEIAKGQLNRKLKKIDGVLIADGHEVELGDYIDIIAENQNGNKVLAYLRVRGDMSGTGIRGMKGSELGALKGIINSALRDITDQDIQDEYFPVIEG